MDKNIKNYRNNLLILFIFYILVIIFNTHLFTIGGIIPFIYGIILLILSIFTLCCLILINRSIVNSAKMAVIIGPITTLCLFVGDLIYRVNLITKFRVTGCFFVIGGILIFNSGRKILKLNI